MTDLLLEIGCEELPAASVMPLAEHLANRLSAALQQAQLCNATPEVFATPRRIAVRLADVGEQQPETQVERRGPAVAAAYLEGQPTKALQGFMRSAGVSVDQLETVSTPKGEWVTVKQVVSGKTLHEVITDAMPEIVKTMPMPKRMRWGSSQHEFLRPVQWLVALHGSRVLPIELLGLSASNLSRGHRFHAPGDIVIDHAEHYEAILESAYVMANAQERRARVVAGVQSEALKLGGEPVMEDALIDEVNALVEWPVALAGVFDKSFLEIPKEALIQTMQENQRYFALLDAKGDLLPAFITVANLESKRPSTVIDGNERVIRPRFADTMFFWNQDKKQTLASHHASLSRLLFQEKLGSVADKVERMGALGAWIANHLGADSQSVETAISLCKCDLNTEIVKELAKMQGICGRYYALREGYDDAVAEAMEQHYFPKQAGGELPNSSVSQVVSLADKTDTLVGIFGLGMKPTGAKDPFALRRASLGIIRIIIELKQDINLEDLITRSINTYGDRLPSPDKQAIVDYVVERMRGYLVDQGYAPDVIDAVYAKATNRPLDTVARLDAMQTFRNSDAAISLSAASKRMTNLLKKTDMQSVAVVDEKLLTEPSELTLYQQSSDMQSTINQFLNVSNYQGAMEETANLKKPVDAFFESVMVMDENTALRNNRLALLQQVNSLCCSTAELSLLVPSER